MFAIVLTVLFACATAAPRYHHSHHHGYGPPSPFGSRDEFNHGGFGMEPYFGNDNDFFRDNMFDTRRFWAELSREMSMLDQLLNDFSKKFPSGVSNEGVDTKTNEYKITVALSGFEEKDIKVKAREGLVMIQAIRNMAQGGQSSYLSLKALPDFVNVTGSWTFEDGVLKIVFPLLSTPAEGEITTEVPNILPTTETPEQFKPESREETTDDDNNKDADVGLARGDVAKETELLTNEVPHKEAVEATTYAVDLKDEVEFVPVRY